MGFNGLTVTTIWEPHHPCGHCVCGSSVSHDLSAKRPSERAGYARRLATKDCAECWKAGRDATATPERATWLAGRRADELAENEAWETRAGMPPLDGSGKVVEWGRQVRCQLLAVAHDTLDMADGDFAVRVENTPRHINSASWWSCRWSSSQRDTEPVDLEELVSDAASNHTASSSGNPY